MVGRTDSLALGKTNLTYRLQTTASWSPFVFHRHHYGHHWKPHICHRKNLSSREIIKVVSTIWHFSEIFCVPQILFVEKNWQISCRNLNSLRLMAWIVDICDCTFWWRTKFVQKNVATNFVFGEKNLSTLRLMAWIVDMWWWKTNTLR